VRGVRSEPEYNEELRKNGLEPFWVWAPSGPPIKRQQSLRVAFAIGTYYLKGFIVSSLEIDLKGEAKVEEDIVDYALEYAKSKSNEYAEVRAQSQSSEGLILRNGVLETYVSAVDSGFNVRIVADGGVGFASTNKWAKEEARETLC
jgi:hypothetical protein